MWSGIIEFVVDDEDLSRIFFGIGFVKLGFYYGIDFMGEMDFKFIIILLNGILVIGIDDEDIILF